LWGFKRAKFLLKVRGSKDTKQKKKKKNKKKKKESVVGTIGGKQGHMAWYGILKGHLLLSCKKKEISK